MELHTFEPIKLKFGSTVDHCKFYIRGHGNGHVTFFLNSGTLSNFGSGEDRHFKFDIQVDHDKYYQMDDQLPRWSKIAIIH